MVLTSRIELCSGVDLHLRLVVWLVWFAALVNLIAQADRISVWLLPLCAGLLCWSWPQHMQKNWQKRRLALYADGKAQWSHEPGEWQSNTWRSRWYTVLCFKSGNERRWLWICASINDPDAYRLLGIWCRFSPQQSSHDVNDSH